MQIKFLVKLNKIFYKIKKIIRQLEIKKAFILNKNLRLSLQRIKFLNKQKKKTILYLCNHHSSGGSERVALDIFNGLDKDVFSAYNISFAVSMLHLEKEFRETFDFVENMGFYFEAIYHQQALLKFIEKIKPDVIFLFGSGIEYVYDLFPLIKKRCPCAKQANIIHNYNIDVKGRDENAIPYIDARVSISKHHKNILLENYEWQNKNYSDRVSVIYNGVDTNYYNDSMPDEKTKIKYNIKNDDFVISWIAAIQDLKDPMLAVEIFEQVFSQNNNAKLFLTGRIKEKKCHDNLKAKIKKYNLEKNVIITGTLNTEEVKNILSISNITILTSKDEGTPRAIMESLAMGKPVISTNVGAVSEILDDGMDGFLIDRDENMIDNFVEKIKLLRNNPDLYRQFSEYGREKAAQKFSLERMQKEYNEFFKELCEK